MNLPFSALENETLSTWPALIADWRDFVFLHFSVDPAILAPHVPYPLELRDGQAFVSLVSFRLEGMRPARGLPPVIGRWLLRPLSDHQFLNVRTYVRGPAGAGIHFITEWIDKPLSQLFGPPTYGLPYQLARMERCPLPGAGLQRIAVHEPGAGLGLSIVVPTRGDSAHRECPAGSLDAFLLERLIAYTHRRGRGRWFAVEHGHWQAAPFQLARFDAPLFEHVYPWFKHARFIGGHLAEGFRDVVMSAPQRATMPQAVTAPNATPAAEAQ